MIIPINHVADWRYIRQRKKTQIDKYLIHENTTRIDHDYSVGGQFIMGSKSVFKYKTPFKGSYETVQKLTNVSVTLQMGAVTTRLNICRINPYKINEDANVFNQYEI